MELMYWISVIGSLHTLFEALTIVFAVFMVLNILVLLFLTIEDSGDYLSKASDTFKYKIVIPIGIFINFIFCFIPSRKELLEILVIGNTIEYVSNSSEAQKLPENVFKTINKFLEEYNDKE